MFHMFRRAVRCRRTWASRYFSWYIIIWQQWVQYLSLRMDLLKHSFLFRMTLPYFEEHVLTIFPSVLKLKNKYVILIFEFMKYLPNHIISSFNIWGQLYFSAGTKSVYVRKSGTVHSRHKKFFIRYVYKLKFWKRIYPNSPACMYFYIKLRKCQCVPGLWSHKTKF